MTAMQRQAYEDDESEEGIEADRFDKREYPDESDLDDDDNVDAETIPCPYCRRPVYEQAERCPHCGKYISDEDAPRRRPWWVWAGIVLALVGALWWIF